MIFLLKTIVVLLGFILFWPVGLALLMLFVGLATLDTCAYAVRWIWKTIWR